MRSAIICGNWKMHLTQSQSIELVEAIHFGLPFPGKVEVIVAPPFLSLSEVAKRLQCSYIVVAAQNLHFEDEGAFTGECSAKQIKAAGADCVIIGHSERRQYFNETDETVNKKIKAAIKNQLIPIICVGESLAERDKGEASSVITRQLAVGLNGISSEEAANLVIAYEPVWAIGTGKTASPRQVEDIHRLIRYSISTTFGGQAGEAIRILYGGSVKAANSNELLTLPNVDGALVGGASLKAEEFIKIIQHSQTV